MILRKLLKLCEISQDGNFEGVRVNFREFSYVKLGPAIHSKGL